MMPPSQQEWPTSINPYRHYVRANGGLKETGEKCPAGAVAIVVPMRDGLKFFKLCFYSLIDFTDHPYTLTVVDHLGNLFTKKLLNALHLNHQIYIERYDEEEFNFSLQVNLGLRSAFKIPQVKYGLILNADAIVEPFWLSKMLEVINSNERMGIVGPRSNIAMPEQMEIPRLSPPQIVQRVSGFCMLFRREVWEELGGFDEQFIGGGFEDWDFCERARRLGWHVAIDGMTHIHHFYKQYRMNAFDKAIQKNEQRFFAKHPLLFDMVKQGDLVRASA